MTETPEETRARIRAALRNEPSPTRVELTRTRIFLGIAGLVVGAAAAELLALTLLARGERRPTLEIVGTATVWLAVAAITMAIGVVRGPTMLGRRRWTLVLAAVLAPLISYALLTTAYMAWPDPDTRGRIGMRCLLVTLAGGAPPLLALVWPLRRLAVAHPTATGAAIGAGVASLASVLVNVHCPITHPAHVGLGHVLPAVILALVGALLAWRLVRPRGSGAKRP